MDSALKPFVCVRVRKLLYEAQAYDGWGVNQRPPQVGDDGVVLEVLRAPGLPDKYLVESGLPGGRLWLSDFCAEEIDIDWPSKT